MLYVTLMIWLTVSIIGLFLRFILPKRMPINNAWFSLLCSTNICTASGMIWFAVEDTFYFYFLLLWLVISAMDAIRVGVIIETARRERLKALDDLKLDILKKGS